MSKKTLRIITIIATIVAVLAMCTLSFAEITIGQMTPDQKNTDELWAERITISEAMKKLNEREKNIITRRIFDGKTQMEVAEEIGISQAQVSRLEKNAIERIKKLYE